MKWCYRIQARLLKGFYELKIVYLMSESKDFELFCIFLFISALRESLQIPIQVGKENRTRSNALAKTFHQQLFIDMCLDIKYSNGFCANTLWNLRKQINS